MPTPPELAVERRAERRISAKGNVALRVPDLGGKLIRGELLDRSPHGFRAAHDFRGLASGSTVVFEDGQRGGRARVAWTRIAGERVESGFCYVPG